MKSLKAFSIGDFYSDDNNYEVCCYFVTVQVAMAVNTSPEVGDKEADYVNACLGSLNFCNIRK